MSQASEVEGQALLGAQHKQLLAGLLLATRLWLG